MENFRIGIYILVVAVLQFFIVLLFGYIKEGGDINSAAMYPVVYWMPAIIYNFFSGLLLFIIKPKKIGSFLILLLITAFVAVGFNEATNTLGKRLYYVIIIASLLINTVYYFLIEKNKRTTSTNKT